MSENHSTATLCGRIHSAFSAKPFYKPLANYPLFIFALFFEKMVGVDGLEPPTSSL